jgi:hypothetical protein
LPFIIFPVGVAHFISMGVAHHNSDGRYPSLFYFARFGACFCLMSFAILISMGVAHRYFISPASGLVSFDGFHPFYFDGRCPSKFYFARFGAGFCLIYLSY